MKRYLCINNVYNSLDLTYPKKGRILLFRQNDVYEEYINDSWSELTDDVGDAHIITPQLLYNFKELEEDLPIPNNPYWDHDSQEYAMLEPTGCARTGVAICAAAAIGAGCLIYLALTWRS